MSTSDRTTENDSSKRTITILIPCYNEQESLPVLFTRMDEFIHNNQKQQSQLDYFIMFVDDGSKDTTRELILNYAAERDNVEYIFLSRNFGKEKAMFAGIEAIQTDAMVIVDADLQDPPELIPQMAELWLQGYEDVYARRRSRKGESLIKKVTSHLYYRLLQRVSNVPIQEDTGDFRLLDRKCIDALKKLNESERNSKALFSWIGYKKIEFLYDRDERVAGKTKWNYYKLFHLAMDGLTSFTTAPLKISSYIGCFVSLVAIIYALVVLIRTLIYGIDVPGYASTLIIVLILGGIQLLGLGVIGEYLGRIFMQTKNRPNYLVETYKVCDTSKTDSSSSSEEAQNNQ